MKLSYIYNHDFVFLFVYQEMDMEAMKRRALFSRSRLQLKQERIILLCLVFLQDSR